MKSLTIEGVAKVRIDKNAFIDTVTLNGGGIQQIMLDMMLDSDKPETSLCEVTIILKPFSHSMTINGEVMPVEL